MALQTLNLLVVNVPTGRISCDLEYDDASLRVTRLFGSNTSDSRYTVIVTRNSDGAARTVTLTAHTAPSVSLPNNFLSVTLTPDGDVIAPIGVSGG